MTTRIRPLPFRGIVRIAAAILTILMILALWRALRRDGPDALAAWRTAHVRWNWVAFSVTSALAGHGIYVFGWRRLLRDSGVHATFWQLARMFLVSNLGRYLPAGKAWQMAIVAVMAGEQGLPKAVVAASSLFQAVVGVAVGAVVLFAAGGSAIGLRPAWLSLAVLALLALLLVPMLVRRVPRVHNIVNERLRMVSVDAATMWTLIWTTAGSWICWGVALYGLAAALVPGATGSVSAYVAAWTASFLAGLIAIVSPAGLGARESIMQVVLSHSGRVAGDVLVVVVVARAWVTVLDVVPAGTVLLLRRRLTVRGALRQPEATTLAVDVEVP